MGLFDQDKADALSEAIVNALRPVGVTIAPEMVQYTLHDGHLSVMLMGEVRESATEKVAQDQESKAALNQMLAEQHEHEMQKKIDEIKRMAANPEQFFSGDDSDECSHEDRHPSGFCLDCGAGLDEEE